jgi:uncharacterized membrane protein YeaQ/YmgE (transglycosylase-associated protein family)
LVGTALRRKVTKLRRTFIEKPEKRKETGMGILSWVIVGLIAGFLAGQVMRRGGYGVIGDIIVGVLGGLLGGWIAFYFFHVGDTMSGINLVSILVAFAGAMLLILVLRMIGGRERLRRD